MLTCSIRWYPQPADFTGLAYARGMLIHRTDATTVKSYRDLQSSREIEAHW